MAIYYRSLGENYPVYPDSGDASMSASSSESGDDFDDASGNTTMVVSNSTDENPVAPTDVLTEQPVSHLTTNIFSTADAELLPEVAIPAFIFLVIGLVGFIILLILVTRRHRKVHLTFTKWFLCHISSAQVLVVITLPLIMVEEVFSKDGNNLASKIRKIRQFFYFLSFFSSVLFLLYISVGQFLSINKMAKKRFHTPMLLYVSSLVIWIISSIACVPVLLVSEFDFANTVTLSIISIYYVICFVFTLVFVSLKWFYDFNQRKLYKMEVKLPTKIEVEKLSPGIEKDQRLRKLCVFITICFYLSWILFLIVTISSHEERLLLLATKENTVLEDVATFFPYAFAAIFPYILIAYFRKSASSMKFICCHGA